MALLSCGPGDKPAKSEATAAASTEGNNVITFKADGKTVNTTGLTISRFRLMPGRPPYLNVTSDMHGEKRTININVNGTAPGTYALSKDVSGGSSHGIYFPDYSAASNSYLIEKGSVVLTLVDTVNNIVEGTFSGEAKNGEGKTIAITEGRIIKGTLTPGVSAVQ